MNCADQLVNKKRFTSVAYITFLPRINVLTALTLFKGCFSTQNRWPVNILWYQSSNSLKKQTV